ncbi:MAG: MerR family transcriptional regulator [Patescibacteria group bacterium]
MSYTVQQLSTLAGVSVRTLHYYNEIGLLEPAFVKNNGYRFYEEKELLKLQQILFFRELDFTLEDIKEILSSPKFDMKKVLEDQRGLIELKKKRLVGLIKTIDKTINKLNKKTIMNDKELYDNFDTKELDEYAKEAKERWGNTKAYKESQERFKKMSKAQLAKIKEEGEALNTEIAANMSKGAKSKEVQVLIARHFNALRNFYEPSLEMYRGLGEMYVADPRFTAYYEKYAKGLAEFMRDAMVYYVEMNKSK